MVFDALRALERYGFIDRHRRKVRQGRGMRNRYATPAPATTVLRLVEMGILDESLRVRGVGKQYDAAASRDVDNALREYLGERYAREQEAGQLEASGEGEGEGGG